MNGTWVKFRFLFDRIYRFLNGLYKPQAAGLHRYGLVLILVLFFFLFKATLSVAFQNDVPFVFSLFIVILSAWFGGLGPGLLATLLSGMITYYFFMEPDFSFYGPDDFHNLVFLILFFIEGIFVSFLSEGRRISDKQKSEFIGVISHELKNPLTSIKGYTDLIAKTAAKNGEVKIYEFAGRIDNQINHVIGMINDLLDITKIETGRLTYQDELFNIFDLLKEIVSDQQVTTQTHKLILRGKTSGVVFGDRYRIGQVLTNLLTNAVKYSPSGKKVEISIKKRLNMVQIAIKDFGVGIAKEDQVKLFLPFFRANNSQIAKGSGIGLFITSEIVKRHKGKLWVESKLGKGSVFYLELPMKKNT